MANLKTAVHIYNKNKFLLCFVIGLLANAINLAVAVLGLATLIADVLGHVLGHGLSNADTLPVEPVVTDVATDIKPKKEIER